MHSYKSTKQVTKGLLVLILVLMEDALVPEDKVAIEAILAVLILVLMEDALVRTITLT